MTDPIQNTPWNRPEWKEESEAPKLNAPIVPCWMTKREYFAALAMQAIVSGQESIEDYVADVPATIKYAVRLADALIERLEK